MTRRRKWQITLISIVALIVSLSLVTLFVGPTPHPAAPATQILNIDGAASWVGGHRCPAAQEACKILFPLKESG